MSGADAAGPGTGADAAGAEPLAPGRGAEGGGAAPCADGRGGVRAGGAGIRARLLLRALPRRRARRGVAGGAGLGPGAVGGGSEPVAGGCGGSAPAVAAARRCQGGLRGVLQADHVQVQAVQGRQILVRTLSPVPDSISCLLNLIQLLHSRGEIIRDLYNSE
jgi:hypothetical protein